MEDNPITRYLEMTGQTFQEIYAGAFQYGHGYILDLVIQALAEEKKIIYISDVDPNELIIDAPGHYELVPLKN